ncbi:hypothetical protein HDU98_010224 [Podochytrium sp. JEL0797]|nr:hypothetical protein HDU98_010224 [Podochytrium sp. JEL0797]
MQLLPVLSVAAFAAGVSAMLPRIGAPSDHPSVMECVYAVNFPVSVADPAAAIQAHFSQFPEVNYSMRFSVKNEFVTFASFQINSACDEASHVVTVADAVSYQAVTTRGRPSPFTTGISGANSTTPWTHTTDAIHQMAGVDKARYQLGLSGKGIKVGIIDTGVYYLHPALGGGFGPGFKVAYGHDFVGDLYDGKNQPIEDNDPLDNCSEESHGTHVAGIVAGMGLNITIPGWVPSSPFSGVAPDVTLGAYRIYGCTGVAGSDAISAAIYKAYADGMDIINMSLGGGPGFHDDLGSIASRNVASKGLTVLAASGNGGASGAHLTSDPAGSTGAISVASFDNGQQNVIVDGTSSAVPEQNGQVLDIVANDIDAEDNKSLLDGCNGVNPAVNVTGKAVMFRFNTGDTGCGSAARCFAAYKAGASACILYHLDDSDRTTNNMYAILSLVLSNTAARTILADIRAGTKPSLIVNAGTVFQQVTGGTVSNFSSPGLDPLLNLKPEIGGIGGFVYSTISPHSAQVNGYSENYLVMSGTSMASAYAAGVTALLLQQRGKLDLSTVRAYLQNNAMPKSVYKTSLTNSPSFQGAGLVNAFYAASAKTLVLPSSLALNDTINMQSKYTITIQNNYAVGMTYVVSSKTAATVTTYVGSDDFPQGQAGTLLTDDQHATVTFLSDNCSEDDTQGAKTVFVPAGSSAKVNIQFQPAAATTGVNPVYGGYITITNSKDDAVISVPYAGVIGSWKAKNFWSRNSTSLNSKWLTPFFSKYFGANYTAGSASTGLYEGDGLFNPLKAQDVINGTDYAIILAIPTFTTRAAQIHVEYQGKDNRMVMAGFSSNTAHVYLRNLETGGGEGVLSGEVQRTTYVKDPNGVSNNTIFIWGGLGYDLNTNLTGPFTPPSLLPTGNYIMRFLGLKNFGDVMRIDDYDALETPVFTLVY